MGGLGGIKLKLDVALGRFQLHLHHSGGSFLSGLGFLGLRILRQERADGYTEGQQLNQEGSEFHSGQHDSQKELNANLHFCRTSWRRRRGIAWLGSDKPQSEKDHEHRQDSGPQQSPPHSSLTKSGGPKSGAINKSRRSKEGKC